MRRRHVQIGPALEDMGGTHSPLHELHVVVILIIILGCSGNAVQRPETVREYTAIVCGPPLSLDEDAT